MRNAILLLVVCILVLGLAKTAYTDVLTYDDFESGWGNYTDGGKDCQLYTGGTHAHQGISAADIQDNSGTSSSFYHTDGIDVHTSGYTQITVDFWFKTVDMDTGQNFMVQYYDGSIWHTVATFTLNVDFDNGVFYQKTVTINEASYNFPTNMKIRFMCNARNNNDDVYIDEISVQATGGAGPVTPTVVNSAATNVTETAARLNGQVTDTGGEDPTVIIYWGDNDGGTTAGNWDNSENMGTQAGTFFKDISGLTAETTYYFRCYASNSGGNDWADATDQFTTQAAVNAPTVVNSSATNVTETTARLNGQVTDTGGEDPTVIIYWGDNDGGTTAGNWDNSENMGTQAGTFFKDISGLTAETTYYFRCYASNSGGNDWADATEQFTTQAGTTTGTIRREYWTGISGTAVTDLTSSPDYPDNPTATDYLTSFDAPIDWADDYGTRIRGYLHPPTSGDYTFWIASDDNSQLWLSTDDNPANAVQIAYVPSWTTHQQWDKFPEQQSTAISLIGGGKYYIEALHKEAGGGDHVSVSWQGPGITQQIIDGQYLSPWIKTPVVVNDGASSITTDSAVLNGIITDTGGEDPTVIIYWGDNDGGTNPGNWDNTENMGIQTGAFSKSISGLSEVTTYYFRCYASNPAGSDWADATDQFTTQAGSTTGTIMREYWTGIGGDAVIDLTSSPDYPDNPSDVDYLTSFDAPIGWANDYGTRIRGYLHPPDSGDYTFWIASDDNSQLWLSTDDNPANAVQIAYVPGWTAHQQWDKYSEQQSTAISLTGGGKYYIEALHKEAGGGDHVSVSWQGPGITQQIIDGQYLSPWIDTPVVVNDGASSITTDSAVLNGIITDTGGEDPTVIIYWGDNDGGTNPGNWDNTENMGIQTGAFSKSISGLSEVTTYYFRCYCSNSGADDWADTADQFTTKSGSAEIIPPTPDPMTWFSQPHAYVSYEVTMEATTASDESGVEYYFACTSGGGHDSGWQDSPVYTDTGLSANTTYAYKVRARDKSANQNETAYSVIKTVTTRDDSPVTGTDIDALWTEIELIPIMVNGDKDNRINVVFLNRWYIGQSNAYNNAGMRQEFIDDINNSLIAALTVGDPDAHTVYQHYSEFFNVYAAWWPNIPAWTDGSEDGTLTWALTQNIRDRLFLPWDDEFSGWATIIAMYNGGGGGGGAGLNAGMRTGDCYIVGNAIGAMLHELSHTFANVSDEYTTSQTAISEKPGYNVVVKYKRDELKWKHWIEPTTPIPTPYTSEYLNVLGCFEGNNYHLTDYFRLTAQNCIMGAGVFDNTDSLCPVCEQRVLMRTNKLVNAAADFSPANTYQAIEGTTQIHFSVNRIAPDPDTQQIKWILNGKTIATGVDAVDVDFGEITDYELVYSLTDVTSYVRENPPYGEYPRRQVRWTITNTNPTSGAGDLQVTLNSQNPKCESTVDGSIDANVSGGLAPYTYIWSTGDSGSSVTGLGEGIYEVTVVDSEFRSVIKTATLNWASTIDIDVRSTFLGPDQWQIDLNPGGTYTYQWSHGPTTPTVTVSDGTYGYTVTNAIGGTLNGSVTVTTPAELFNVTIGSFATDTGLNTGKILLDVSGGIAPYSFLWADTKQGYGTVKRYEAEDAQISIPDSQIKDYYDASGGVYLKLGWVSGDITWTVNVANAGLYKLDFVYATTTSSTLQMSLSVNGGYVQDVDFTKPPLQTGVDWDSVAVTVSLNAGTNTILLQTTATEAPHLDYLRAGRNVYPVPITLQDRAYLASGAYTVIAKDDNMTAFEYATNITDETSFNISGVTITEDGPYIVSIVNPDGNYDYYWYANDVPRFEYEQIGKPLHMGTTFSPYKAGNFYLASRLKSNNLESSNRIGFAISTDPKPGQIQENGGVYSIVNPMPGYEYYWYDQAEGGTPLASGTSFTPPQAGDYYVTQRRTSPFPPPVNPDVASSANLLLWLDATDMDGDGTPDTHPIGPYLDWTDRTGNYHLGQGAETFYKPAVLNGNGVSSWELVWIKFPPTSIQNYQTLMMVYKESSVSFTKSSPFVALNNLIGRHEDISVQMFDDTVSDLTKNGTTYVNSIQVDPFSTPMLTEFYLLTVEFSSTVGTSLNNTEGRWEGTAGEILLYDGLMSTSDREGVEEYLSQKWLSSAHLESERKQFTAN